MKVWSVEDAMELYNVPHWGKGYFSINTRGNVTVRPHRHSGAEIDLKELVDSLGERGIHPPVLLRFTDILRHRVGEIAKAFQRAIRENEYQGKYCCVYPIKVNQQKQVVEEICDFGQQHGFGLEAGSKPELLAVLAMTQSRDMPIICNGFKDDEFIEMVILAQKMGKRVIPVVEKFSELELIARYSEAHNVRPELGVRVKLAARGSGRWEMSGGARSKFGLFIYEVLAALDYLKQRGMADCLKLLHFHLGSQITNIRNVKDAINELARVYVQLQQAGAGLEYLDIGGGLGVDYDGSQTNYDSSMNYTLDEYASDAVYRIKSICDEATVPHPTIISESGRAMVAYHSLLVFEVVGVSGLDQFDIPEKLPEVAQGEDELPQPLIDLFSTYHEVTKRNTVESYHDAVQGYDQLISLFNLGHLSLDHRSLGEKLFWGICNKVNNLAMKTERVPEDLQNLPNMLSDTYFCNFSVFQSMPDSWAIDHVFPVMPIHRLRKRPTRRGILADITCDSDGKIDSFADLKDDKYALELHPYKGDPYYIGAFLVGAYQEILGDMHNLLGDTHVVHVSVDEDGEAQIEQVVTGDTVSEVLGYVQYSAKELVAMMRREAERAIKTNRLTVAESTQLMRFYESGLEGYTYLE
jgi:arginine decarboxylase